MAGDLYDRDFYLWTQTQAEALRARSANALDYDLLAEEVGDMGKRDARECGSRVRTILEHLMKLSATRTDASKGGWRVTILTQRSDLSRALTPAIRNMVDVDLEALHHEAAVIATASFAANEPDALPLDATLRWTLAQVLGEENDPLA